MRLELGCSLTAQCPCCMYVSPPRSSLVLFARAAISPGSFLVADLTLHAGDRRAWKEKLDIEGFSTPCCRTPAEGPGKSKASAYQSRGSVPRSGMDLIQMNQPSLPHPRDRRHGELKAKYTQQDGSYQPYRTVGPLPWGYR